MHRVGLPSGGSTLMTSAPNPASVRPQYSACSSAISMTRMPVSDPGCAAGAPVMTALAGFARRSIGILVQVSCRTLGGLGRTWADWGRLGQTGADWGRLGQTGGP